MYSVLIHLSVADTPLFSIVIAKARVRLLCPSNEDYKDGDTANNDVDGSISNTTRSG